MTMLIPFADLAPMPWKNDGGSTTEIVVEPSESNFDDFDWRISLAAVTQDGPFSPFPGIDRTLALVDGPALTLDVDGCGRFVLGDENSAIAFTGEAAVQATLNGGPTIDFNVMTRRATCHHRFGLRRVAGSSVFEPRGDRSVLFLAGGGSLLASSADRRIGLALFDTIVCDTKTTWVLEATDATIFTIDIFLGPKP